MSQGKKFRAAVARHAPLQIPGAINAYSALLAERAGFKALYLSGAGVANASFGLPDLGVTALGDVLEDARRIAAATDLPLLATVPLDAHVTEQDAQGAPIAAMASDAPARLVVDTALSKIFAACQEKN